MSQEEIITKVLQEVRFCHGLLRLAQVICYKFTAKSSL